MAAAKQPITDNDIDQAAKETGSVLADQEKVKVKIPLPQEEKQSLLTKIEAGQQVQWPAEEVWVNGYKYVIQKGKDVEVPQTVAEILEQAGII